jgi:hypothetical protein
MTGREPITPLTSDETPLATPNLVALTRLEKIMGVLQIRRERFHRGECPDCGFKIAFYWFDRSRPWCKRCGYYYELAGVNGEHVMGTKCSQADYDRILAESTAPVEMKV